jgi:hypothetical protein
LGIPAPLGVGASGLPLASDQANAVLSGIFLAVGPSQPFAFRGPMNVEIVAELTDALTTTAGSLTAAVATGTGLAAGDAIASTLVPYGTTIAAITGTAVTLAVPPVTLTGLTQNGGNTISGLSSTTGLVGATVTGPGIAAGTTVLSVQQAAISPVGTQGSGVTAFQPGIVVLSATTTANLNPANVGVPYVFTRTGNAITASGTDAAATFRGAAIVWVGTVQLERSFTGGQSWSVANTGGSGTLAQYTAGTPVNFSFGEPERNVLYRLNCTAYTSGTIRYRISETGAAAESLSIPLLA